MKNIIDPGSLGFTVIKMMGDEALVKCPFHNDNNPSATFNVDLGLFHCFGCNTSKNLAQLEKEFNLTAIKVARSEVEEEKKKTEWKWILNMPLALNNEYLQNRGVTNEQVKHFGIRDTHFGVAVLLENKQGVYIGAQIRKYNGNPKYIKLGKLPPIWPFYNAHRSVYLVEGVFGVLNAHKHGIKAITSLGASVRTEAYDILRALSPVVLFDDDFAGYLGASKVIKNCGGMAVIPGREADEFDWNLKGAKITGNLIEIMNQSENPKKIKRLIT